MSRSKSTLLSAAEVGSWLPQYSFRSLLGLPDSPGSAPDHRRAGWVCTPGQRLTTIDDRPFSRYNTPSIPKMLHRLYPASRRGTGGQMSITPMGGHPGFPGRSPGQNAPHQKITTATLRELKLSHEPITCLTA